MGRHLSGSALAFQNLSKICGKGGSFHLWGVADVKRKTVGS